MKLSTWRSGFLQWFQKYTQQPSAIVSVNGWTLENPDRPGLTQGFLPPLRDLRYTSEDTGEILGHGTQDFFILLRYPRDLRYQDLPIGYLEGLQATVSLLLVQRWDEIGDLIGLTLEPVSSPVQLRETEDNSEDWVAELTWTFRITWLAEAEVPLDTPFELKELNVYLWRWQLDEQGKYLDYHLKQTR